MCNTWITYQLQLRRPRSEVLRFRVTADGNFTCLMSTVGLAVAMDTIIDLRFLSKMGSCLVYSCSITPLWGAVGVLLQTEIMINKSDDCVTDDCVSLICYTEFSYGVKFQFKIR